MCHAVGILNLIKLKTEKSKLKAQTPDFDKQKRKL